MADRNSNPLVSEGDPHQTTLNCRAVLEYIAPAVHENDLTGDQKLGRYLILDTVSEALEDLAAVLLPESRRPFSVIDGGKS